MNAEKYNELMHRSTVTVLKWLTDHKSDGMWEETASASCCLGIKRFEVSVGG